MDKALLKAILEIAKYQRGGIVVAGEFSGDRDEMIGIARQALTRFTGAPSARHAFAEVERILSESEAA